MFSFLFFYILFINHDNERQILVLAYRIHQKKRKEIIFYVDFFILFNAEEVGVIIKLREKEILSTCNVISTFPLFYVNKPKKKLLINLRHSFVYNRCQFVFIFLYSTCHHLFNKNKKKEVEKHPSSVMIRIDAGMNGYIYIYISNYFRDGQ